jgi:hypothetical protein
MSTAPTIFQAEFHEQQINYVSVLPLAPVHFGRRHASQTSEAAGIGLPSRRAAFNLAAYLQLSLRRPK